MALIELDILRGDPGCSFSRALRAAALDRGRPARQYA